MKRAAAALVVCGLLAPTSAMAASVEWVPFVINDAHPDEGTNTPASIVENGDDGVTTNVLDKGDKTAYGTKALDGKPISDLLSIDLDVVSVEGEPAGRGPYFNIWVTDPTQSEYA